MLLVMQPLCCKYHLYSIVDTVNDVTTIDIAAAAVDDANDIADDTAAAILYVRHCARVHSVPFGSTTRILTPLRHGMSSSDTGSTKKNQINK